MNTVLTGLLLAAVSGSLIGFTVCDVLYRRWLKRQLTSGIN